MSTIPANPIDISTVDRIARVDNRTVRLSVKEYALLNVLATAPTRVFSKEELLQKVWNYRAISGSHTRTLDAHCARLRRKLDPDYGRFVVNCWGVGYRLVGP